MIPAPEVNIPVLAPIAFVGIGAMFVLMGEVFLSRAKTVMGREVTESFIGTVLEQYLREAGIAKLVIVGLTTDHCVSASTRMASDLGFEVTLVSDATAAFERIGFDGIHYSADEIHRVNLVSLDGEFCRVRSTTAILDEII